MLWHAIRYSQRLIPFTSGRFSLGSAVTSNFDGLEAGKVYGGQVRALGGATGMNDWCDPTTHMAM